MVDQEVVDILAEIRDKVRASKGAGRGAIALTSSHPLDNQQQAETNGFAGLTVLNRAWDRLPPIVTKRTGPLGRLDLWLKGLLKRALRWLTWEQVNFNSATHQTFIEVIDALQQQNASMSRIQDLLHEVHHNLERQLASKSDLSAHQSLEQRFVELVNEYHSLVAEFRDRDERLFDEQRISLKQFSLELSESHVLQDRSRRELETRIAKLEKDTPTT
jgi:hypothetical protein